MALFKLIPGDDFVMTVLDHATIYGLREDLNYKIGLISNVKEDQDLKCSNKEILMVLEIIGIFSGNGYGYFCISVNPVKNALRKD